MSKELSNKERRKMHLTGPDCRFYKRSECPIPNSIYTQEIVEDYLLVLHKMKVKAHSIAIELRLFSLRIPWSKQTR